MILSYAILKHKLIDIKAAGVISMALSLLIFMIVNNFFWQSTELKIITTALIIFITYLLINNIQKEAEHAEVNKKLAMERAETLREVEQRSKNLIALQHVSSIIMSENNTKKMVQRILDELPRQLTGCIGGLLSISSKGHLTPYAMSSNAFSEKILSLIGGDMSKYRSPINRKLNYLHRAFVDKVIVESDRLSDFISPKISKVDDSTLRTQVIDTGRGIAKSDQNKLFQKFSQVKREVDEHQGTGLGLYISKNFVELHKGKIWVDSEEGKGATFSFDLPILKSPPKEVDGAILERPISASQIEVGKKIYPR